MSIKTYTSIAESYNISNYFDLYDESFNKIRFSTWSKNSALAHASLGDSILLGFSSQLWRVSRILNILLVITVKETNMNMNTI